MRRPVAGSADRAAGTQRAGQTLEIPERWSLPKRSGVSLGGRLADSHHVVRDPPSSVPIGEPRRIGPRRHGHGADARCVRQVDAVCSASADTFRHDTGPGSYGTLRQQTDPRLSRAPRGEQRRSRWLASALPPRSVRSARTNPRVFGGRSRPRATAAAVISGPRASRLIAARPTHQQEQAVGGSVALTARASHGPPATCETRHPWFTTPVSRER